MEVRKQVNEHKKVIDYIDKTNERLKLKRESKQFNKLAQILKK